MTKLLEIFGRAITVKTSDVLWHWLNTILQTKQVENNEELNLILTRLSEMKNHIAEELISQYIICYPESIYARMAAAIVCLRRNQYQQALKQLESVYFRQPFNTMALYAMGFCYELLDKEEFAVEFYQDCLKFKAYLQLPRQRLACIDFKNGKIDSAIEHFCYLTKEYPDDISSHITLGYLYIANSDINTAVDIFNTAIAIQPDNYHQQIEPAKIKEAIASNQIDILITKINLQIVNIGHQPDLYVQLGDIYAAKNDFALAITNYQKASRLFPSYLDALIKLGSLYLSQNQKSLAIEEFNKAAEVNDEIIDAYIGLAKAYAMLNENKDALETLSLAASLQQNSSLLFAETATLKYEISFNTGEKKDKNIYLSRIIEAHRQLSTSKTGLIDANYKLGLLYFASGDYSRALESLKTVMIYNPIHCRGAAKAAICMYELGEHDNALELLAENRLEINSNELDLYYKTSLLFYNKFRFQTAMYNIGIDNQDDILDHNYDKLAALLDNMGLTDRAKVNLDRLSLTYQFANQLSV